MSQPRDPSVDPPISIPFNRPYLSGAEFEYISEALRNGQISGGGPFTRRAEALIEQLSGAGAALLTSSCTDALELSAVLLDLTPGDEVIVPSFTFVSTANAFALRGARLRFVDIRADTLNLDESKLEAMFSPRTRAVVPVHYAGVGCEMDEIVRIARARNAMVIEDNAHGFFGRYRGRNLGTFGTLATLSFHETKNVSCGEGGALLINDSALVERAEIVREKGTNRSRFVRGQVDKYTWVDLGSSYLPSEILAAYLLAQLESAGDIQKRRSAVWYRYANALDGWARTHGVRLPFVPDHCEQPFHMFYLLMPSSGARTEIIRSLRRKGILSVFHYVPLHSSPMGIALGGGDADCPVTDDVSSRLVRLPFFNALSIEDQERTIEAVLDFVP